METLTNFVGGSWVASRASEFLDVHNPATGEVLGTVAHCDIMIAAESQKDLGYATAQEQSAALSRPKGPPKFLL